MAEIISMSLPEDVLAQLAEVEAAMGFSGRSETLRAGLNLLIDEQKQHKAMKGVLDAIILIIYEDRFAKQVSEIRHDYQHIIKTQVHNHLKNEKCLEIFVLNGSHTVIREFYDALRRNRKFSSVRLILP